MDKIWTNYSYNELVVLGLSGNELALNVLFSRLSGIVLKWIKASVDNPEEIADLHQDVMLHLLLKIRSHSYKEGYFMGWIRRLVINYLCSYYRKKKQKLQHGDLDVLPLEMGAFPVYYEKVLSDLVLLLPRLSAMHRDLIKMRYWGKMSYREIAHYTGINYSTVVKRVRIGCRELRYKMEALGYYYHELY